MSLRRSVSISDSSLSFRTALSSVRDPPIHLGRISCVIEFRVRVNVLHITITIICSLHSLGINSKLSMMCLFTVCFREFSAMLRGTQVKRGHLQLVECSTACFHAPSALCCRMSPMSFQPVVLKKSTIISYQSAHLDQIDSPLPHMRR